MSASEMVVDGPGIAVEIGRIDKELGKLWEEAGESKTRASLINLVLYSEDEADVDANTRLVAEIASQHACRAIVILARPHAPEPGAHAWINAHCHMAGKRQICSEQITFRLEGEASAALPSIVFSHLDSDLPLCLWWQAPFSQAMDESLWTWVDRLIFDSATWANPAESFDVVAKIGHREGGRTVLGDLNWARVLGIRFAIAALFDHSAALAALPEVDRVEIQHAPGSRTTAVLLLGWLASRLGWKLQPMISRSVFVTGGGREIEFDLQEGGEIAISRCAFSAGGKRFCLEREPGHEFFTGTVCGASGSEDHSLVLHAGRDQLVDLLLSELARGGRHGHYREALASVRRLFEI